MQSTCTNQSRENITNSRMFHSAFLVFVPLDSKYRRASRSWSKWEKQRQLCYYHQGIRLQRLRPSHLFNHISDPRLGNLNCPNLDSWLTVETESRW